VPRADYRVALGGAIRARRKRARLTQERLAEKADLHPNYLGRVERGEEHVSLIALRRIAKMLKCRVRDLVWDI
jgi:XRE family transcriptional regulator, regulator of sulfur utilization